MPKKPDLPMPFGVRRHADGGWELTDLTMADAQAAQAGTMDGFIRALDASTLGSVGTLALRDTPEDGPQTPTTAPAAVEVRQLSALSRRTVAALYATYIKYEQAREASAEVGVKKVPQIRTRLKPFLEHFGTRAINALTTFDMEQYARALAYYPANLHKLPAAHKLVFDAIVALSKEGKLVDAEGKPAITIAASTHAGYINDAVNFLDYCRRRNAAGADLIEGLKVKAPALRKGTVRRAFLQSELQKIFNSDYYRDGNYNKAYQYWIPLIGAFTGARLNEIAQLSPFDIKTDDEGLWYFDITTEDDSGKSLKNSASKRIVPMHSQLLALGLIKYVQAKRDEAAKNLFDIAPAKADKYSKEPGRWFNDKYLRAYLKIAAPEVVFHSFRHRFITSLSQAIFDASDVKGELIQTTTPALILRRMVGHSAVSVLTADRSLNAIHTDTYTGAFSIRAMARVMELLTYPDIVFHRYQAPTTGVRKRMKMPD